VLEKCCRRLVYECTVAFSYFRSWSYILDSRPIFPVIATRKCTKRAVPKNPIRKAPIPIAIVAPACEVYQPCATLHSYTAGVDDALWASEKALVQPTMFYYRFTPGPRGYFLSSHRKAVVATNPKPPIDDCKLRFQAN
jgi:hypothetical protein